MGEKRGWVSQIQKQTSLNGTYFRVLPGFPGSRPMTVRVSFYWPSSTPQSARIQGKGESFPLSGASMAENMRPSSICHYISKCDAIKQPSECDAVKTTRGDPKPQKFINKNCLFILTCFNFSHLQSTLHLMQYTYRDNSSTVQNSF